MPATHIPTKLIKAQWGIVAGQAVNFGDATAGNFKILAVKAGAGLPNLASGGIQYVADLTAVNPEDTLIGARQSLTTVTLAFDATLGVVDWSFDNITYAQNAADDALTRYFGLYYVGVGAADASFPLVAILDPGQLVNVQNGSAVLQCPTGGLIQQTGGG